MADDTNLPGIGLSVLIPYDQGFPVNLPSPAHIAGVPPPPIPTARLASAQAVKSMFNPIFALFNSSQDRITSV